MSEQQEPEIAGQETSDAGTTPGQIADKKPARFVRRTLSEQEMKSAAVVQLILDENERLQEDLTKLRGKETSFHEANTDVAVLKEKLAGSVLVDILFTVTFGIGVVPVRRCQCPAGNGGVIVQLFVIAHVPPVAGLVAAKQPLEHVSPAPHRIDRPAGDDDVAKRKLRVSRVIAHVA